MLEQIQQLLTPKEVLIARDKRRLQRLLQDAGLSRAKSMATVGAYFRGEGEKPVVAKCNEVKKVG